ncbi:hypothetical protein [Winogradskyella sp.]|uniref:hypothetical protein n=1 Tax=Winogradskyella sp. TaxID=1883156 RepID=UPI0025D66857|nr:hypothetical protein [Winogradskyella sp.]
MSLTILENNGIYNVKGSLTADTARSFQAHCELIMNQNKSLKINVELLTDIDDDGVKAIRALYMNALYKDCSFFIEGNRSKKLYKAFPFTVAAA